MTYNMTNITNAVGIYEQTEAVNQLTGGWFGIFIIGSVFMIILIAQKNTAFEDAIIVSGFVTTIVAIMLLFINFIPLKILMFPIMILVGSLIYKMFSKD